MSAFFQGFAGTIRRIATDGGALLLLVGAIGVYSMFGETVKKQTGAMAAALAGNNEKAVEWDGKSKEMIDANEKKVTNNKDLADFAHDNQLKK